MTIIEMEIRIQPIIINGKINDIVQTVYSTT